MARGLDTTKRLSLAGWRVLRFWTEVVPAAEFGSGHDVPRRLAVTAFRGGGGKSPTSGVQRETPATLRTGVSTRRSPSQDTAYGSVISPTNSPSTLFTKARNFVSPVSRSRVNLPT
jgi:hypothetical protein